MISGGPAAMQLGRVRASLLDFYVTESDELIVEAVSGSSLREEHVEILVDWARTVGYERIWLPDQVIDIEADPAIVGVAKVKCRTCGYEHPLGPCFPNNRFMQRVVDEMKEKQKK